MSVGSPWFLTFAALVVMVCELCPGRTLRQALLSLVNLGFLVALLPNGQNAIALALVIVGSYLLVRLAGTSTTTDQPRLPAD